MATILIEIKRIPEHKEVSSKLVILDLEKEDEEMIALTYNFMELFKSIFKDAEILIAVEPLPEVTSLN